MQVERMNVSRDIREILSHIDSEQRAREIDGDASLFDGGLLDSLRMVELIASLEKEFSLRIAPHELVPDNFESINRISDFVARSVHS